MPLDAISTCSGLSVYRYSNIAKNYRVFNGRWRTDFIISVARGAETKLSSTYSASNLLPPLAVSPPVTIKVCLFLQHIL